MRRSSLLLACVAVVLTADITPAQDTTLTGEDFARWLRRRPNIARIEVAGNAALKTARIRNVMELKTASFWAKFGLRERPRLLPLAIERDQASIKREYRALGFWDADVDIQARPGREPESAHLTVLVTENTRSYWGDIQVTGDHTDLVSRIARYTAPLSRGRPADSLSLAMAQLRMVAECANRAHPAARVHTAITRRPDTIDVRFDLSSGPDVVLGEITYEGLVHTRESVVRRELRLSPGQPYSRRRLDERQQDVYATGLFTFVRLDPQYADTASDQAPRTADLRLRVVERPPSFLGFRTGAGQDQDRDLTFDYAVDWGSRNWLGSARRYALTATSTFVVVTEWRVLHHRFSGNYVEPYLFGFRLPTTLELAYEPRVRSATQDYRIEKMSGELSVTRRFKRVHRIWSALIYERVNISGIPAERREDLLEEEGITIKRRWAFALERDTRPNLFVPTSGALTRLSTEFVGGFLGGRSDFYKVDLSWARYQIISDPTVLASRIRLGWAGLHSGGDFIPTIDRFYLGGANSIRGYSENTVGPADTLGSALGGEVIALLNLELRTPVTRKFWFTLFGDLGNNWARFSDIELESMLMSLGIGWQYIAPVGPLRIDYARRVLHHGHPASDRIHLSILFSF